MGYMMFVNIMIKIDKIRHSHEMTCEDLFSSREIMHGSLWKPVPEKPESAV